MTSALEYARQIVRRAIDRVDRLCTGAVPRGVLSRVFELETERGKPFVEATSVRRAIKNRFTNKAQILRGGIPMKSIAECLLNLRRKTIAPLAAIVVAALAVCASIALAQSGAGAIQGTVTDSSGAVLPGASIHVVNQATGVAVDTKTNNVGFYQVPGLNTGTYAVTITAPNMKTYNRVIELLVGQTFEADASMTTGSVSQQVTVSANTVQLETTDNGSITSTLENARINELPMNGRNIIYPGERNHPGLESCPESSSCANGQEGPSTEYETDGATLTSREFGGTHMGSQQMVDPDSVQEVRVIDEAGGAQYASPSTVILNTKSGTNQSARLIL